MAINHYLPEGYRRQRGIRPELHTGNRLMFITHETPRIPLPQQVEGLLEGGCAWIQLRMKEGLRDETAEEVVRLCEQASQPVDLCIDDQVDFALKHRATAVHVGKKDMPVPEVWTHVEAALDDRQRFFVGATANTFEDIRRAVEAGASYIGLGPFRFTQTKKNLSPILGLEGYRRLVGQCREAGWDIPIFAIGGIGLADVKGLMQTGVDGLAVSGSILQAASLPCATAAFLEEIQTYHQS
ncbi:MAG: thiamine phosphate synthase [Parabacteroides sp.]